MNPINPQPPISVATQADIQPPVSNVGQGRSPIDENKHIPSSILKLNTLLIISATLPVYFGEIPCRLHTEG